MSIKDNNKLIKEFVQNKNYDIRKDGHIFSKKTGKEIGFIRSDGYKYISFSHKSKLKIHRIIWCLYGDTELSEHLVINHKDGNKLNNSIDNLEQVSQAYNNLHAFRILKRPAVIGNCKINKKQAEEIRKLHNEGWTYLMLMEKYNVGKTTISYVINKKIWK